MRRDTGKGLRELWLRNQGLAVVSSRVAVLRNLRTLDISSNKLRELPSEICSLSRLERLMAGGNALESLPIGFSKLSSLQEIYLKSNSFREFPGELLKMKRLISVDLSDNKITLLPPGIVELRSIAELSMDNNPLSRESIAAVDWKGMTGKLRRLGIGGDVDEEMQELPKEVFHVPQLCMLRVPRTSQFNAYCNYMNANIFKPGFDEALKLRPDHGDVEQRMFARLHACASPVKQKTEGHASNEP